MGCAEVHSFHSEWEIKVNWYWKQGGRDKHSRKPVKVLANCNVEHPAGEGDLEWTKWDKVTRLDWRLKNQAGFQQTESRFLTGVSWAVAMASRCRKCGQQVPRNLPFTAVRITEGEMKSYHEFIGGCIRLEHMAKKGMCSIFKENSISS